MGGWGEMLESGKGGRKESRESVMKKGVHEAGGRGLEGQREGVR